MPWARSQANCQLPALVNGGVPGMSLASRGGATTDAWRVTPGTLTERGSNRCVTRWHPAGARSVVGRWVCCGTGGEDEAVARGAGAVDGVPRSNHTEAATSRAATATATTVTEPFARSA